MLRTKALVFEGRGDAPRLFINAVGAENLTIAVLSAESGEALPGLDGHSYIGGERGLSDSERLEVGWASDGARGMSGSSSSNPLLQAQGKPIVLEVRFGSPTARLYSFWFASDACGASHGWVGAGGPGFNASSDTVGSCKSDPQ